MNKRILMIDDEPDVLSAYKRNLKKHFNVHTAINSSEALKIIKSNDEFAVFVADFKMPGMNGIALLSILKKISPNTIRVLITGHPDTEIAIDAVNDGEIYKFLTKPYPTSRLIRIINECITEYNSKLKKKLNRI